MRNFSSFIVTEVALAQARKLGMYGDPSERLRRMARLGTPLADGTEKFRFNNYVLSVEGNTVNGIADATKKNFRSRRFGR